MGAMHPESSYYFGRKNSGRVRNGAAGERKALAQIVGPYSGLKKPAKSDQA